MRAVQSDNVMKINTTGCQMRIWTNIVQFFLITVLTYITVDTSSDSVYNETEPNSMQIPIPICVRVC